MDVQTGLNTNSEDIFLAFRGINEAMFGNSAQLPCYEEDVEMENKNTKASQ